MTDRTELPPLVHQIDRLFDPNWEPIHPTRNASYVARALYLLGGKGSAAAAMLLVDVINAYRSVPFWREDGGGAGWRAAFSGDVLRMRLGVWASSRGLTDAELKRAVKLLVSLGLIKAKKEDSEIWAIEPCPEAIAEMMENEAL